MIECYSVGEKPPFPHPNGLSIMFGETGFVVAIQLDDLTQSEISAFHDDIVDIYLCQASKDVSFFVFSINNFLELSDVAFTIFKTPFQLQGLNMDLNKDTNQGYAMTLILIDGHTNIIKAMRLIGLSNEFSQHINNVCIEQSKRWYNDEEYQNHVYHFQKMFTPLRLIQECTVSKYVTSNCKK